MQKQKLELMWVGKEKRAKLEPRILIEDPEKSYHADKRVSDNDIFDNMLIHGDNLLALKALEQDYAGRVKCIYIDPPYNTGNAFEHYDDGLEHSIWLSLMRERLELLKNLLSDDGSIFINIDECEYAYLKVLLDEIFGRKNHVCTFIWYARAGQGNTVEYIAESHEYILFFSKNIESLTVKKIKNISSGGNYSDSKGNYKREQLRQWGQEDKREDRPSMYYAVKAPDSTDIYPKRSDGSDGRWRVSKEKMQILIDNNDVDYVKDKEGNWSLYKKIRSGRVTFSSYSTILDNFGTASTATMELKQLFSEKVFDTPKPESLVSHLINLVTNKNDLVLDSFLGSGTTAAVAHKMGRRWIGIELGEHCDTCCVPRLKKVIDGEDAGGITKSANWRGGGGFRYYNLAPSLVKFDEWGNPVINKDFNENMLVRALCKVEGFNFDPSPDVYWKQGKSTESDFIYVTTQHLTAQMLQKLSDDVGDSCTLLICCGSFDGKKDSYGNLTIKKIPKAILKKCEWNHDDYSLEIKNLPMSAPDPQPSPAPRKKSFKKLPPDSNQLDLF